MAGRYYSCANNFTVNKRSGVLDKIKGFLAALFTFVIVVSLIALFVFLIGIAQ